MGTPLTVMDNNDKHNDGGQPAYRIDGQTAPREAFYAVACDPRRSVVVEACAGAGKTWMLVSRILRALLDGALPQEILAITFTRKAAGEMRARLDEWLAEFAAPACTDAQRIQALRERGLDAAAAARGAPLLAGLYERVLESGRTVEIRTFHAWFSQLLRAAPLALIEALGLRPEMEIVDDLADHRSAVFTRFHAAVLADEALQQDYCALVAQRGRSQALKWLEAAWAKRTEIELADAAGTLAGSVPPAIETHLACAGLLHPLQLLRTPPVSALLAAVAQALAVQPGAVPRKQGAALADAIARVNDAECHAAVEAALFTQSGSLRKNLTAPGLALLVDHLDDLRRAVAQQQAHEEHARMVRLSRCLLRELALYKRERGLAEMADLEGCALTLLRDAATAGWVHERLDARVHHVLIDEFQDTSPLQWHALHAWLSGYSGAGGGASGQRPPGVFIVGDPKQSIYRFRRAEPKVFDAARQFVVEGLGGAVLGCDHTRRNAPELVDVLNRVFTTAQDDGLFGGFRSHTTQRMAADAALATGVFLLPCLPRPDKEPALADDGAWRDTLTTPRLVPVDLPRQREADAVADAVAALLAASPVTRPRDVQVLCRKRESLRLLAQSLAARQLPFTAAEDQRLIDSPEVRDLVALLDALVSPGHALSLAQALRSPVFGASDDDLIALATAAQRQPAGWWQALQELVDASPALQRARGLLQRWREAARALPPHDLIDRIMEEGDWLARTLAAVPLARRQSAAAALDAVLQQALVLDGARYATPYTFVRALKRRRIRMPVAATGDAIALLTIHGAKGLEAPVVFVMDAWPEPAAAETATVLVDWPVELAHPRRCAFVYAESQVPASLQSLQAHEAQARRREELNSLYVAMTRARDTLVFSATAPHLSSAEPAWRQRVQAVIGEVPPPWCTGDSVAPPPAVVDTGFVLSILPAWRPPANAMREPLETPATPAMQLGRAVHRALEWCTRPQASPVEEAAAVSAAAAEFGCSARQVAAVVHAVLSSAGCAAFFAGPQLLWAGNEVAVSEGADVLRIDRLVALQQDGQRHWWVLDYKLQHHPEALGAYQAQLRRYCSAVRQLQPLEPVHGAFINASGELMEVDLRDGGAGQAFLADKSF